LWRTEAVQRLFVRMIWV